MSDRQLIQEIADLRRELAAVKKDAEENKHIVETCCTVWRDKVVPLTAENESLARIEEAARACFDSERPGVWYPSFIEILRTRVHQRLAALSHPSIQSKSKGESK